MTTFPESQSSTSSPFPTESEYISTSYSSFSTSSTSPTESSTVATTTFVTTSEGTTAAASLTSYTSESTSVVPSSPASSTSVANNTTSSVQSSQQHTSGSKISTGALAGAIVGAFAGGCVLALLVAFLCLRGRKKSPHLTAKEESSVFVSSIIPKSPRQTTRNVPDSSVSVTNGIPEYLETSTSDTSPLDLSPFVPEAADDSAVCMRIQTFFDQVSLHVDNYYSRPGLHRQLTSDMVARINGYDSSLLGTTLATLLSNSRSQRPILTHTLLHAILLAIQYKSQEPSLIPACYRLGAKADLFNASDDRAIFAWRMLTSHLYVSNDRASPSQLRAREYSITCFANSFTEVFAPYGDPQFNKADRLAHMTSVTRAAVDLGVWLLSQPCSFDFCWSTAVSKINQVVILPAVVKTCDEHGVRMALPQVLLEECTRQV
ncbi:hypothetical protein N7494_007872 [Penicillium frequentans]|uniref:Uncharacterized protein n=1 Tax=Penicillium frequentans TaxID=3151616 RepID=A0AAD6GD61_9EURO|nr:hypothetical protein N7494_007872 [Penicillium glabrum]